MCQKEEQKNGKIKLDSLIVANGSIFSVLLVRKSARRKSRIIEKIKHIIVHESVRELVIQKYLLISQSIIKEYEKKESQSGFILLVIDWLIPKELLILKQDDMQDKEMQKVITLLRNGKNFAERIIGDVRNVKNVRNLQKTILNLFLRTEQIILQISSHFVGRAIVGNGSFTKTPNF